ncbi:MAG: FtsH protease activity modulator HflK [Pseudomonadota bacterium]
MPWEDNKDSGKSEMTGGGPWGQGGGKSGGNGGGNGGSPWNRPGGGGSGGDGNRPDLEEQMRRMQERFRGRGGGRRNGGGGSGRGLGKGGLFVLATVAIVAWLASGVVIVDAGQQASVFRFGKWTTNFSSGLHFHLPVPIETHEIIPVEERQELSIGQTTDESLMLTADENIVDTQFSVFWKVKTDAPQDFILNVKSPRDAVRQVAESVMREVVGKSNLENIITNDRAAVQLEVQTQAQALLDEYRAGIELLDVQIRKADPPAQVIAAFNDVNVAEQDAETRINQARQEANRVVPEARGTAERLLRESEGYRDQVIADANGEAERFNLIYDEYRQAPRVTRERMFFETLEQVVGQSEVIILDSESGAVPYLPLDRARPGQGG